MHSGGRGSETPVPSPAQAQAAGIRKQTRGLPTKPLLTGWPWRFQRYREDLGYQRSSGPGGERVAGGIDLQGFTVGGA